MILKLGFGGAILIAIMATAQPAHSQPAYDVITIEPALDDLGSIANAINDNTQVVGWSIGNGVEHAYFWEQGRTDALPAFGQDGRISVAYGINNAGQVVGESEGNGSSSRAALWTRNGDVWEVENLGSLPNYIFSRAIDINAAGTLVVGFIDDAIISHAALWEYDDSAEPPWVITDLGLLPNHEGATAAAVNSNGTIVGSSGGGGASVALAWQQDQHGVWQETQLPGLPGGGGAFATGVNASDVIVGTAAASDGLTHAVIWTPDTAGRPGTWQITDLGKFANEWTYGLAINDQGQVVGETRAYGVGIVRAILIDAGVMYDLNDLVPPGWDLKSAYAINNLAQIAGRVDIDGFMHSFLLTPTGIEPCPGDLDGDGDTDQSDLGILLSAWGIDDRGDLDGDGDTDQADLGVLLADWGCGS